MDRVASWLQCAREGPSVRESLEWVPQELKTHLREEFLPTIRSLRSRCKRVFVLPIFPDGTAHNQVAIRGPITHWVSGLTKRSLASHVKGER